MQVFYVLIVVIELRAAGEGMYKNSNWRLRLGTWEWQLSWGVHTVNVERWRSGWTARSVDSWTYTVQWTHTHINTKTLASVDCSVDTH